MLPAARRALYDGPMTDRLYYTDPVLRRFSARVVERRDTDRGPAVRLDRTAFYPTSGGQPHDTGTLGGAPVLDVWDDDTDAVWHLLERPVEGEVEGAIDWERRFDHMQQHTGQHLLSAAFVRLLEAPTLSFHLGTDESSIDLDVAQLGWDDAFRVEAEVNRVIWEDRPVEVHFVGQDEIGRVPLRKPPKVTGTIRVVWIRDIDASACGGTHVTRTGAVGLVKIVRLERYKGGMRVGFLCGGRALAHYQRVLRGLQTVGADLSVHVDQVPETVARLAADLKDRRRELETAREALTAVEADRRWAGSTETDGARRIAAYLPDYGPDQLTALASHLAARPRTVALVAGTDAKGIRIVCKRSDDLPDVDAGAVLRRAVERLGGRGGGRGAQAQGGAPPAPRDAVEDALREAVERLAVPVTPRRQT
jgi:alanyl-tRNA synthetase